MLCINLKKYWSILRHPDVTVGKWNLQMWTHNYYTQGELKRLPYHPCSIVPHINSRTFWLPAVSACIVLLFPPFEYLSISRWLSFLVCYSNLVMTALNNGVYYFFISLIYTYAWCRTFLKQKCIMFLLARTYDPCCYRKSVSTLCPIRDLSTSVVQILINILFFFSLRVYWYIIKPA